MLSCRFEDVVKEISGGLPVQFKIVDSFAHMPNDARDVCYLIHSDWDDWYEFAATYALHFCDRAGVHTFVGRVKIGKQNMEGATAEAYQRAMAAGENVSNIRIPTLPTDGFSSLPDGYFSLGTEDSYYEFLGKDEEHRTVLVALRDMAYDLEILRTNHEERIVNVSLLRGISMSRVENRFAKLAHGEAALTDFEFQYRYHHYEGVEDVALDWKVSVDSVPPSNIKVIIGRNGVGKTFLLRDVISALCRDPLYNDGREDHGEMEVLDGGIYGVVFASLSAFEGFKLGKLRNEARFEAIGCVKSCTDENRIVSVVKDDDISSTFAQALFKCRYDPWRSRWLYAISLLKSDPMFEKFPGEELLNLSEPEMKDGARNFFNRLSSGHAAMMLLVTQLVRVLDEKFLVLLDEPECHLHPPLLASFLRCLSYLLQTRNAVCLIATHSPVALQEVSRDSVWILRRYRHQVAANHPSIETFGENVGVLMQEVFGLEMDSSGYHRFLAEIVSRENISYEQVLERFHGRIGVEARAILRVMIAHRDSELREVRDA